MNEEKKYRTIGIVPKFPFKNEGDYLEGHFVEKKIVEQDKKKPFTVWIISDAKRRLWSVSGGHIDYLFNEAKLSGGEGVLVTWTGWDEMEGGNKCRTYSLQIEQA